MCQWEWYMCNNKYCHGAGAAIEKVEWPMLGIQLWCDKAAGMTDQSHYSPLLIGLTEVKWPVKRHSHSDTVPLSSCPHRNSLFFPEDLWYRPILVYETRWKRNKGTLICTHALASAPSCLVRCSFYMHQLYCRMRENFCSLYGCHAHKQLFYCSKVTKTL